MTNASSAGRGGKIIRLAYLVAGIVWLVLTLLPRGATLIYLWPWPLVLTLSLAVPLVVPLWRTARGDPLPRLGGAADWAALALLLAQVGAALLSPFRAASLGQLLLPIATLGLLYEANRWRRDDPEAENLIVRGLAWMLILFTGVSLVLWLMLTAMPNGLEHLWEARNPHPLGHSNYTAGVLLLLLPFGMARLTEKRSRVGWSVALVASLFCLFTAGSRAALLGLGAGGVTAGLLLVRTGWCSARRALLLVAVCCAGAAVFGLVNPRLRDLLRPASGGVPDDSTIQRAAMREAGREMIGQRPLLGWGPGTTPLAYPRFRRNLSGGVDTALQLHNAPLQIAADIGIVGFAAVVLLLGTAAWAGWRSCAPSPGEGPLPVAAVAGVAVATYGVFALYDFELDVPFFPLAGALCLALLFSPRSNAGQLPRWMVCSIVAVVLGVCLVPRISQLHAHALLAQASDALENENPTGFDELALQASAADANDTVALNGLALQFGERSRRAQDAGERSREAADAEHYFTASLARNPDQEICETNFGWLLLSSDPTRAETHFLAAAKLVPDKEGLGIGLAEAALARKREVAAAAYYATECLSDPRFLVSPYWSDPNHADLRSPVLIQVSSRAAALAEDSSLATWQRRELLYLSAFARWLDGRIAPGEVSHVALNAEQRTFFNSDRPAGLLSALAAAKPDDILRFRAQRPGYGVLMRNLDAPMPVDFHASYHYRLFMTEGAFLLPERLHLPGRLLLAEYARAGADRP